MSSTQVNGGNGDGGAPNAEEQCKKDEHYYFELVVFKVEDTLFRVPKSVFNVKDSAIGDMFLLPNVPNNAGLTQGSTDESPIVFEDKSLVQLGVDPIKKADFQALLRVMLPLTQTPLTYEEWVGVLHLSTMWFYTEIRARAIANLTTFIAKKDVCSNILLAKKYGVRKWLIDGYINLIVQTTLPIFDELYEKGVDTLTLAKIYYIRNALPPCKLFTPHTCTNCGHPCQAAAGSITPHYCGNYPNCYNEAYCSGSCGPTDADISIYKQSAHTKVMEVFSSELSQLE